VERVRFLHPHYKLFHTVRRDNSSQIENPPKPITLILVKFSKFWYIYGTHRTHQYEPYEIYTHNHHLTLSLYFPMKKLLFVSILLLLLPLTGCKSVVKDTVVEKQKEWVLYGRLGNGELGWYEDGDEKKDGKYVGEIENRKPNGQGTHTYSNGEIYVGKWKGGSPWIGTKYNKNGKILGKWVNGKFQ